MQCVILTGERKQSVVDAERMLSYLVAKFLDENCHGKEGRYVRIVAGWHEAADGRGLSELARCKKNYDMVNMILDDWMPWYKSTPNFATIDINKYVVVKLEFCFLRYSFCRAAHSIGLSDKHKQQSL